MKKSLRQLLFGVSLFPLCVLKQKFPDVFDPNCDFSDFFPLVLNAFGGWNGKIYGPPFDNYSGLLYYNKEMLKEAGFDKPPETWDQVMNDYGPVDKKRQIRFCLTIAARRDTVVRQLHAIYLAVGRLAAG
ncbi:MAG: extracellular solute-binding protein [Chthoniobacterales bacterium]